MRAQSSGDCCGDGVRVSIIVVIVLLSRPPPTVSSLPSHAPGVDDAPSSYAEESGYCPSPQLLVCPGKLRSLQSGCQIGKSVAKALAKAKALSIGGLIVPGTVSNFHSS